MALEEQLRLDFSENTAYEQLVLEAVVDPNKAPPGTEVAIDDIRGGGPRTFGRSAHDSIGGGSADVLTAQLRPLAFGAAYKILDFTVEMVMDLNHEPRPGRGWTFTAKIEYLGRGTPIDLPTPLDQDPGVWVRLTALYAAFDEHRHAVIHRRARVEANGDFTGSDRAGNPLDPITIAEMNAFSRFAAALAKMLGDADVRPRQLNRIAWFLDALQRHHSSGLIGATPPPTAIRQVKADMTRLASGAWQVDGSKLHAHLREQECLPIDATTELHAVEVSGDRIFEADVDEVPDAIVEIDLAALPPWLRSV